MPSIPPRLHAVLDYVLGALLAAAPWVLGIAYGGAETWTLVGAGLLTIANRLLTKGPLSARPSLPSGVHRAIDGVAGGLLTLSPLLLGFAAATQDGLAPGVAWPHVLGGLLLIALAVLARSTPQSAPAEPAEPAMPPPPPV